jgi:formate-dependent nitrite reductase membrane component NrfD
MASWMVKGAWILVVFIILGLAYALPSFEAFGWLPWNKTSDLGRGIGIAAALLSILVVIYPGFLLGVVKGIPSWHASILPPLFFFSALDTGIALLVLIALFFPITFGADGFHQLGVADIGFILMQLIALGAFLEIVRHLGVTATATIRLLKTPLFIGGVIILGLLLPLGLLLYSVLVTDALVLRIVAGITSALLLAGGLFLRYSILSAGVYFGLR